MDEFNTINDLARFADWVARWVCNENFEENAGAFAELACRRLNELGYIRHENGVYMYEEEV